MAPDSRRVVNSSFGVGLAAFLARSSPPWLGHRIAYFAADWIAGRKDWQMVKAVRTNQWIVSGGKLRGEGLDRQVRETFRNTARSIYEVNHDTRKSLVMKRLLAESPVLKDLLNRPKYAERGLILAGVHLGNFDFIIQAVFLEGMQGLVLTVPELVGGYKRQFEMRKQTGMELVPATNATLRRAIVHLRQGGGVVTGMDRPVENPKLRPLFFGRPSCLPVHHVYLALKAQVPMIIAAVIRREDESYMFLSSEPIEMKTYEDRDTELLKNAEMVCQVAEGFIRQAPEQWAMSFPVWPQVLDEMAS